jgi:hypothetical protein
MADSGSSGGEPIDIKVNIDLSAALRELQKLKAEVWVPDKVWPGGLQEGHFEPLKRQAKRRASLEEGQFEPAIDIWRVDAARKGPGGVMEQGHFEPYMDVWKRTRAARPTAASAAGSVAAAAPVQANASPAGQPYKAPPGLKAIGAVNSSIGGTGTPSPSVPFFLRALSGVNSSVNSVFSFQKYSNMLAGAQGGSYLGSAGLGWLNMTNAAVKANAAFQGAAGAGALLKGAGTALLVAGAVYKGGELAAKVASLGTAAYYGSGEKAMQTPGGQFLNDVSSLFDKISNFGGTITNGAKMAANFNDAVAAVTGKLPDAGTYIPQFYRMADAQMQFQNMVRRNFAMTKAGAMGRSDPSDVAADMFLNVLSGL